MMRPKSARERKLVMATLQHVVEGLARALGSEVEIVLHDITRPSRSVVAIANGEITGRTIGSSIISGPADDLGLSKLLAGDGGASRQACTIVADYRTRAANGNPLESTSMIFRDAQGEAFCALCINTDRSKLRHIQSLLGEVLGDVRERARTAGPATAPDIETLVQTIVDDAIGARGKPVSIMTKDDKMEAVDQMRRRGIFLIRSSADLVARGLGVSRFTIYNYLEELKQSDRASPASNKVSAG
jgi:predicted transcriptional regulator YheO